MREQKNGFTLVELIAVMVVLAVILAIAVPTITNVVRSSTKAAFESDAKLVLDTVRIKLLEDPNLDPTTIDETNITTKLGLLNENYEDLKIEVNNGMRYIDVDGGGKWAGYSACGTFFSIQVNEGECANDFYPPIITLLGASSITIEVGDTYADAGATATDDVDGNITNKIIVTGTVNPNLVGTYVMRYDVSDNAGHNAVTVTRTVNVIDTKNPIVNFGTNGNITWAKTRSSTVTVSDAGGVNTSSLKYLWTTSTTVPTEVLFITGFTNGETITSPADVTGGYYLWILAKDHQNNTTIVSSNIFNLDNTAPVITMNGSSDVSVNRGSTYSDAGATATDDHSGLNGIITTTGTVNVNVVGTYTINYNVSDNAGNAAIQLTRTVNVIDVSAPIITILGSNPVSINAGSTYSDAGATAIDDVDGNVTSKIVTTGTVNPNVVGTYTITYTVKDNANNQATATRTVNVIDNIAPTVVFGTNGNATYAKSRSTTVTVSDLETGVNTSSLKYQWTTSTTAPSEASFTTGFTNGGTISSPVVTGGYYLWILAKDNVANTTIIRTNVFNLDNTVPVIADVNFNGYTPGNWTNGNVTVTTSASDANSGIQKYQASADNGSNWGDISNNWVINTDYVANVIIRAIDNAGNISASSSSYAIRRDATAPTVPTSEVRYGSSTGTIRANNSTAWSNQTLWWGNFSATDATSGNSVFQYSTGCTGSVSGTLGVSYTYPNNDHTFCIRAVDNAGNISAWSTATYIKADTIAPVITMNGSSPVGIIVGSSYSDAGASATDNLSGLASAVQVTSTVNPSVQGTYYVYYNVSDNAGNAATQVVRTVNVISSTFTFTTAGATGRYGPSQAQINSAYTGTSLAGMVTSSSGIQLWTVPANGTYKIETWGAGGGLRTDFDCSTFGTTAMGMGTRMIGNFSLTAGTQLKILVGQKGSNNVFDSDTFAHFIVGGGGGGTFVTYSNNSPLIVAGGGGGQMFCDNYSGILWAQTATYGNPASGSNTYGGGGGGLNGNGAAGTAVPYTASLPDISGKAFVNGGTGGANYCLSNVKNCSTFHSGDGGFGGGSGGYYSEVQQCVPGVGCATGGATVSGSGGGYSGGNSGSGGNGGVSGSNAGGGGGSYNGGTSQSNSNAYNSGDGRVIITYVGP